MLTEGTSKDGCFKTQQDLAVVFGSAKASQRSAVFVRFIASHHWANLWSSQAVIALSPTIGSGLACYFDFDYDFGVGSKALIDCFGAG